MAVKVLNKSTLPGVPNKVVANVIAKLSQGTQAGDILGERNIAMNDYNGGTFTYNAKTNDLRIISPRVLITLGGANGEQALSQSLSKLYNTVVGSAYDTTSFSRADLGKHILIGEGFTIALDMIDRFIDTYNVKEFINKGFNHVTDAERFSIYHNGSLVDFADLVAKRNTLIPNMNKLLLPSSIPWLNKHRSLFRHVFADDMHEKTQLIVPVPEQLYETLGSSFEVLGMSYWTQYLRNVNSCDIIVFIDQIYSHLESYVESAWFKDISPYLWRAMLQPNGPKVDKPVVYEERNDVVPGTNYDLVFDFDVVQLIRNADYIGQPLNNRGGDLAIREDNDGVLRQGYLAITSTYGHNAIGIAPLMTFFLPSHTIATNERADNINAATLAANTNIKAALYPCSYNHKFMNGEDFPSSDDTIYQVMNATVVPVTSTLGGINTGLQEVASCGDVLFTDIGVYFYIDNTNVQYREDIIPVEMYNIKDTPNWSVSSTGYCFKISTTNALTKEDVMTLLYSLNCCPLISILYVDALNNLNYKTSYVDKDNIIPLPTSSLQNAHKYIMFHAMELSASGDETSFGKQAAGNGKGGKSGRRFKNKGKSKGKDNSSGDK